ncbi:hypothetical protein M501DRAFT_1003532 [Patellaria atrata CBS 101060]|uniref:Protein CMS1 n=1 Tax=Patellaria atrata CBS 101060 TaxID=1346257 RepID=A0A9P4SCA1_9PEZI|nr:hypothetical protein M501DRAFT_1003532 [Patellaria atrata CBS 101060]
MAPLQKKRPREPEEETQETKETKKAEKKRRKNKFFENSDVNIALMDGKLISEHLVHQTKRFNPDLTPVELEDRYISERAIMDTSRWEKTRDLKSLPIFMEYLLGKDLKSVSKSTGTPHTLIVASAGLRAADLTRAVRKFQTKEAHIIKLFAKHIKLQEAIENCQKTKTNIGVGTPQRISELLDDGALKADELRTIIIDASYIDQKKRGILDMRETLIPLVELLSKPLVRDRFGADEKKIDLVFY